MSWFSFPSLQQAYAFIALFEPEGSWEQSASQLGACWRPMKKDACGSYLGYENIAWRPEAPSAGRQALPGGRGGVKGCWRISGEDGCSGSNSS